MVYITAANQPETGGAPVSLVLADLNALPVISQQCAGNMHLHCQLLGCACSTCHNVCGTCGKKCASAYTVPDRSEVAENSRGKRVCAACYLAATARTPRGQGCEDCGGPKGYRNLRDPSNTYRCISCHELAGTQAVDTVHGF